MKTQYNVQKQGGAVPGHTWARMAGTCLFALLLLLIAVVPASAAYDLNTDWGNGSDTNNPHGAWSLQYGNNPLPLHYWHASESAWFWDWSGTTVPSFAFETLAKWNDCQPGDIVMQGVGSSSDPHANIRWTAPRDGAINIRGRTWDAYGGRGGGWSLYVSSTNIAAGTIIANSRRTSPGVTFAENLLPGKHLTNVMVVAGTQVIFNQDYATAAVEITIAYQPVIAFTNFGVRSNRFSFAITGDSNTVSIVQACTNLAAPVWTPVATNTLTGGSAYFSDATWSNHPVRFYRVQLP